MIPSEYAHLHALSIRQPWASEIILGTKDVENRTWPTKHRGPVLIHAAKSQATADAMGFLEFLRERGLSMNANTARSWRATAFRDLPRGGIIGIAEIVDCVEASESPWFVGPYGFVLRNAKPLPFIPCKGLLGFFKPETLKSLEHAHR
jgi:hypothetical protein